MPVRPQFNVTELAAAGKQADLETERRSQPRASSSWRARRQPPPPLKQVSSGSD
jgi:hypothetical protein